MSRYGWIPEWPKGADCKSVSNAFGGSNPPPSISAMRKGFAGVAELADAQDLKSNGWIVKFWQIFLKKSRILKFHI